MGVSPWNRKTNHAPSLGGARFYVLVVSSSVYYEPTDSQRMHRPPVRREFSQAQRCLASRETSVDSPEALLRTDGPTSAP